MPTDNTILEAQQLETRLTEQFACGTAREQIREDMCLTTKSTRGYSVACAGILVIHWLMSQRTNEMVSSENVELESPRSSRNPNPEPEVQLIGGKQRQSKTPSNTPKQRLCKRRVSDKARYSGTMFKNNASTSQSRSTVLHWYQVPP